MKWKGSSKSGIGIISIQGGFGVFMGCFGGFGVFWVFSWVFEGFRGY
jgi:hypothetical protein